MTSTTLSPVTLHSPNAARRVLNVARLHLVNRVQIIVQPWLIMSFIFAISLLIGWIVRVSLSPADFAEANLQFGGAFGFFLIYMLVLAVMAINQTFPFAQSYSVTRRDFYVGTVLTFLGLSVAYSILITFLGWIEDLTNGWGARVALFSPDYFSSNLAERLFVTVVLFVFFLMTGMAIASVYMRWRVNGMLIFFGVLTLILVGLAALATFTEQWPTVGTWFAAMGLTGVVAWTLVPSALCTVAGYLLLRKATPRN